MIQKRAKIERKALGEAWAAVIPPKSGWACVTRAYTPIVIFNSYRVLYDGLHAVAAGVASPTIGRRCYDPAAGWV